MTGPQTALDAALDRAAEVTARAAAASRDAPVEPAVRAALDEAGGPTATGPTDWDELWRDPQSHGPEGTRVVQRALVALAREIGRAAP